MELCVELSFLPSEALPTASLRAVSIFSLFKGLFKTCLSRPTVCQVGGEVRTVTKANVCALVEIAVSWGNGSAKVLRQERA